MLELVQLRAATFVRHVELHDELASTNDRAIELARDAEVELPALVIARRQTAGRGRGSKAWWAAEGALTFSVLLDPAAWGITQRDWPKLSLATAVAICDALQTGASSSATPLHFSIKWPNDILLEARKIAGILIESPGGSEPANQRVIIGIGININNSWHASPLPFGLTGIALCDATGRQHRLQELLTAVLRAIDARMTQLTTEADAIAAAWGELDALRGRRIVVEIAGRTIAGICHGIARDGKLILELASGIRYISNGTVRISCESLDQE